MDLCASPIGTGLVIATLVIAGIILVMALLKPTSKCACGTPTTNPPFPITPVAPVAPVAPIAPVAPVVPVAPVAQGISGRISLSDFAGGYALSQGAGGVVALAPPATATVWTYNPTTGYITNSAGQALTVNGSTTANMTRLTVASPMGSATQLWNYNSANRTITLRSTGKALSIAQGAQTTNGGNVWMWDLVGSAGNNNQHWILA